MVCCDTARFSVIQLFWESLDSYSTDEMTQHTKLQNVDLSVPKRGPQIKIWQLIRNQGPKLSIIANLKILTVRGGRGAGGPKLGSQNQFFQLI